MPGPCRRVVSRETRAVLVSGRGVEWTRGGGSVAHGCQPPGSPSPATTPWCRYALPRDRSGSPSRRVVGAQIVRVALASRCAASPGGPDAVGGERRSLTSPLDGGLTLPGVWVWMRAAGAPFPSLHPMPARSSVRRLWAVGMPRPCCKREWPRSCWVDVDLVSHGEDADRSAVGWMQTGEPLGGCRPVSRWVEAELATGWVGGGPRPRRAASGLARVGRRAHLCDRCRSSAHSGTSRSRMSVAGRVPTCGPGPVSRLRSLALVT